MKMYLLKRKPEIGIYKKVLEADARPAQMAREKVAAVGGGSRGQDRFRPGSRGEYIQFIYVRILYRCARGRPWSWDS